jgi:hypothetical protein
MQEIEIITLNKPGVTDFAKERNELLKKTGSEWVFFLDTDEIIPDALANELKKLDLSKYDGFYVRRDNYFWGKYVGTDKILRLMKRGSGKWVRSVHEVFHLAGGSGRAGELKNPIIHNTANSISQMIDKINFYSTLHAEALQKEGKRSNLFKIIIWPVGKFIYNYVFQFGFLNGMAGLMFAVMMSFHSFLSWSKLWISQKD